MNLCVYQTVGVFTLLERFIAARMQGLKASVDQVAKHEHPGGCGPDFGLR